jgi:hypothetical protein
MIYTLTPDFNFDPHNPETIEKYRLPDWEHWVFDHLKGGQEWRKYLLNKYEWRYPSELSRANPNLALIPQTEDRVLISPEPISFYGIKDLVLSTDMPINASYDIFSTRVIAFLKINRVNFLEIPIRVYFFDTYPEYPDYPSNATDWEYIKENVPYADGQFSGIKLIDAVIDVFEDDSIEKREGEFLYTQKNKDKITFRKDIGFDDLPFFFKIPTSGMICINAKNKEILENITNGIRFNSIGNPD